MRKKLREEAGLSMVEMLAATVILTLLALMLTTGLQMVLNTYQTIIAKSEVDLLLSTAVDSIADELRYAWNVQGNDGDGLFYKAGETPEYNFLYSSDSYGDNTYLAVDSNGQIVAKNAEKDVDGTIKNTKTWPVLSTGAYGKNNSYKEYAVTEMTVTLNKPASSNEITFDIHLKVETTDSRNISAETDLTVRCLNPA